MPVRSRAVAVVLAAATAISALAGCSAPVPREIRISLPPTRFTIAPTSGANGSWGGGGTVVNRPLTGPEVQILWWGWVAGQGGGQDPVRDPDGRRCAQGQPAGVWFLAGTYGGKATRTCVMPSGRRLAFPVVNLLGPEPDCRVFMAAARGSAVLDGRAVPLLRVPTGRVLVALSVEGTDGLQVSPVMKNGCGLWVQHEGLAPGRHTLAIRGSSGTFSVAVDYALDVRTRS